MVNISNRATVFKIQNNPGVKKSFQDLKKIGSLAKSNKYGLVDTQTEHYQFT